MLCYGVPVPSTTMPHRRISKKLILLIAGDLLFLYAALSTVLLIRYSRRLIEADIGAHVAAFAVIFLLWIMLFAAFGFYELRFARNERIFLYRLLRVMAANTVLAIVVFYFFPFFTIEPRRNLLFIALAAGAYIFAWRFLFNTLIVRAGATRALFLGVNAETVALAAFLRSHPQMGHRPVGFVSDGEGRDASPALPPLPQEALDPEQFTRVLHDLKAELIVVSPEMKRKKVVVKALFAAIPLGVSTVDFAAFHEMLTGKIPLSLIGEAWFLENLIGIRKRSYELGKRAVDMGLAFFLLLVSTIAFPLIALAITLDSRGPVLFRQRRAGRHGRAFTLIKYRSMVPHAESIAGTKDVTGDTRQTRIGAILRKNYIDELPQIINIFKGEMSFVGPRPERPEYVAELKKRVPFYEMRLLVPPGITGWAQIHMDNDASVEDAPEKMQYDLYYIKNRSFTLDLLIMLRTLFTLVRRQGR